MNKKLWIIFSIVFVNFLGFGIILPLMPYYAQSLGASPIIIGFIFSSYSLAQLIASPLLGEYSDKIGRRQILLFSLAGTVVSFVLLGFAKSIPILFLARLVDGISGGNVSTAQASIADITDKKDRAAGMGILGAAIGLGFILGPALGGYFSKFGYSVPAFLAAIISLISFLLTYFFLPETRIVSTNIAAKKRNSFSIKGVFSVFSHPLVGELSILNFLITFAFTLMQGVFALYSQHTLKLTVAQNGILFAYLGIIGISIQLIFLKKITSLIKEKTLIITGLLMLSLSLTLIALSTSLPLLFVAVTLMAIGNSTLGPTITASVSKSLPPDEQGNIMGIFQSLGSLARLFAPVIGTFLFTYINPKAPFFTSAFILFAFTLYKVLPKKHPAS